MCRCTSDSELPRCFYPQPCCSQPCEIWFSADGIYFISVCIDAVISKTIMIFAHFQCTLRRACHSCRIFPFAYAVARVSLLADPRNSRNCAPPTEKCTTLESLVVIENVVALFIHHLPLLRSAYLLQIYCKRGLKLNVWKPPIERSTTNPATFHVRSLFLIYQSPYSKEKKPLQNN